MQLFSGDPPMIIQLAKWWLRCARNTCHVSMVFPPLNSVGSDAGLIQLRSLQAVECLHLPVHGLRPVPCLSCSRLGLHVPGMVSFTAAVAKCMTNQMEQIACQCRIEASLLSAPAQVSRGWRQKILFQFLEAFIDLCEIDPLGGLK